MDEHNSILLSNVHPSDYVNPEPLEVYDLVVIGAGVAGLLSVIMTHGIGLKCALIEKNFMGFESKYFSILVVDVGFYFGRRRLSKYWLCPLKSPVSNLKGCEESERLWETWNSDPGGCGGGF